jgi:hypothetical protein
MVSDYDRFGYVLCYVPEMLFGHSFRHILAVKKVVKVAFSEHNCSLKTFCDDAFASLMDSSFQANKKIYYLFQELINVKTFSKDDRRIRLVSLFCYDPRVVMVNYGNKCLSIFGTPNYLHGLNPIIIDRPNLASAP